MARFTAVVTFIAPVAGRTITRPMSDLSTVETLRYARLVVTPSPRTARELYDKSLAVNVGAIQLMNGVLGVTLVVELDKAEIALHLKFSSAPIFGKQVFKISWFCSGSNASNVEFRHRFCSNRSSVNSFSSKFDKKKK
eukprot:542782_1